MHMNGTNTVFPSILPYTEEEKTGIRARKAQAQHCDDTLLAMLQASVSEAPEAPVKTPMPVQAPTPAPTRWTRFKIFIRRMLTNERPPRTHHCPHCSRPVVRTSYSMVRMQGYAHCAHNHTWSISKDTARELLPLRTKNIIKSIREDGCLNWIKHD